LENKQYAYEKRVQNSSTLQRPLTRRKCDEEFKQQSLKMIRNGQTVRSVAEALGISDNPELSVRRFDNGCQRTERSRSIEFAR
jgi:transposase-like protein